MTASETLPISLVAHTVFCPRRAWLEAVSETVPSVAIEHGVAAHDRVDTRQDERSLVRRSVALEHPQLGLTGKCDVVDGSGGSIKVIEFKSAPLRRSHEVTDAQRVQLALQRLCLEAAGEVVEGQAVYFTTARRTVDVDLTDADLDEAADYVRQTREIVTAGRAPEPLVDDPKCTRCSHASVCLPDERRGLPVRRRILVPDPGSDVLHVTVPGARVSLKRVGCWYRRLRRNWRRYPWSVPRLLSFTGTSTSRVPS